MAELNDPYDLEAANARFEAAGDVEGFLEKLADVGKKNPVTPYGWLRNIKNVTIGAYKAALNTIETGADLNEALSNTEVVQDAGMAFLPGVPLPVPKAVADIIKPKMRQFLTAAHALSDEVTANNTLQDDIVQGVAQFALPFAAYMRAAGGVQAGLTALNVAKAAGAEAGAVGAGFGSHEGRLADLIQLGRESEGRFGELLRKMSPDGSAVNTYINWMTDRENEGEWEGRFKNIVDNFAGSVAVAGVLKSAAVGFRTVRQLAAEPMRVGPAAQRGAVGDLDDITRVRALKNTQVEEGGEHIVLEGDTLNTNADVVPIRRPYAGVPDSLMGFRRTGPNKTFEEAKFSKGIVVRVTFEDGQTFIDGMNGLNAAHALERARRNWDGAKIEKISDVYDLSNGLGEFNAAADALEKQ